jgi:hypothetical protein
MIAIGTFAAQPLAYGCEFMFADECPASRLRERGAAADAPNWGCKNLRKKTD